MYVLLYINHFFFSVTRLTDYGFHVREIILSISNLTNIPPPRKIVQMLRGKEAKDMGMSQMR